MNATETRKIEALRQARRAFRDARHALARAVLADAGDRELLAACWALLRASDRLASLTTHPARRHERTRQRWRHFALAGLHGRVPIGLDNRAHQLFDHEGKTHER